MTYTCSLETPLGTMTAAVENDSLTGLWFVGQKYYPVACAHWQEAPDHPLFAALGRRLSGYFSGGSVAEKLPLAPQGSPFQLAVWEILLTIPHGRTVSYGEIARRIAGERGLARMSAQAVGGAVGHNPLTILIPCHRVLGFNGRLTGYAGGLDRKLALLRLEGVEL